MNLQELKDQIDAISLRSNRKLEDIEVVIPNNKRSMGPIGTTKVTGIYQGIDWNSGYLIICPEVKMEEAETIVGNDGFEFDNSSTIPPDNQTDVFINYLRRETGMSKESVQDVLFFIKEDISTLCKDWYRTNGKKTSTQQKALTLDTNVGNDGLCDAKSIYGSEDEYDSAQYSGTLCKELTLDERMHLWFESSRPNRDVCDSVDEMNDIDKAKYLDKCGIPR